MEKTLYVEAGVRYWEDASVNGVEDTEGSLIPCRIGELWMPVIDLETGKIENWKEGTEADIHYKVCDQGTYIIRDETGKVVKKEEGYVPDIMSPAENGYGDYIIMKVNAKGFIENWKNITSDFTEV